MPIPSKMTASRYKGLKCYKCGDTTKNKANYGCVYCQQKRRRSREKIVRAEVIERYGNKCACCGEKNYKFLTIDHIINRGKVLKRKHPYIEYKRMLDEGFKPKKYRVLCYNCNCGRQANGGICPHKERK
jgi:hypothetical protein